MTCICIFLGLAHLCKPPPTHTHTLPTHLIYSHLPRKEKILQRMLRKKTSFKTMHIAHALTQIKPQFALWLFFNTWYDRYPLLLPALQDLGLPFDVALEVLYIAFLQDGRALLVWLLYRCRSRWLFNRHRDR